MTARQRALWVAAAAVAGWSGWVLLQPAPAEDLVARPAARTRAASTRVASTTRAGSPAEDVCIDVNLPTRTQLDEQIGTNPFLRPAPKVVQVAPPPPPVVVAPPPPPPPQPSLPTLPYRYLGMLAERDGSDARVFLMMGDKMIMARVGDVLDGGYRLEHIAARELRFVRPIDNLTLKLSVEEGIAS
jgi:hypothetical protein